MTCLLGSGNKVSEISALLLHDVHCACLSSGLQADHHTLQHTCSRSTNMAIPLSSIVHFFQHASLCCGLQSD